MTTTFIAGARLLAAYAAAAIALSPLNAAAYSWERPHATSTNTGLFDTTTIPAKSPLKVIQNIGTFAPGAGPVIGPDGTVFVGNEQGKLMTFHADGTPWWSRDVPGSIVASPLLDAAGSVYVIAVHQFTDHRVTPAEVRLDSVLHKFSVGGGWIRQTPLPGKYGASGTTAAPNMWKSGNAEVIMVPIAYELPLHGGWETHLLALSTDAQLMADATIGAATGTVTGGSDLEDWQVYMCLIPPFISCFLPGGGFQSPDRPPSHPPVKQPLPTAAIFTYQGGGTPFILVADGFQNLVGFTFGGMNFNEIFRDHIESFNGNMVATPTVTYDGHTIYTAEDGIRFGGPNMNALKTVKDVHTLAAPTILRNGKVVVVTTNDNVVVLNGDQIDTRIATDDFSMASAAASHNQFFLSTYHHFITFDSNTMEEVGRYDWPDGGLSSPVIGPQGNVYVISGNALYVFPGPGQTTTAKSGAGAEPPPVTQSPAEPAPADPTTPPAQSSRQAYKPPLTTNGNRLFACENPDGDDCGKGDAKEIAKAFCAKQGFTGVDDIDTDTKKVKAETLDGQLCTQKKCKVFSKIVCEM